MVQYDLPLELARQRLDDTREITEAVHWYVQGRNENRTPIFDSMCAFRGSWLYGPINTIAVSNKRSGSPVTKDGEVLQRIREEAIKLQPPFLLRWSPSFFATEAPDVFERNARERVLQLREKHRARPPWMRLEHNRVKNTAESWLYLSGITKQNKTTNFFWSSTMRS